MSDLKEIREKLTMAEPHFAMAMPESVKKFMTPERCIKLMLSGLSRQPNLLKCTIDSILKVCMEAASLGLEPCSSLGHLYAVPYHNKITGKYEAIPIIGYRGLLLLARRSGDISSIECRIIHEHDRYKIVFGINPVFEHEPVLANNRGMPLAAYCLSVYASGQKQLECMTYGEIESVRLRSKSKDDGPWTTDWLEMAKKTVLKRAAKMWPLSSEVSNAIAMDNEADSDQDLPDQAPSNGSQKISIEAPAKDEDVNHD